MKIGSSLLFLGLALFLSDQLISAGGFGDTQTGSDFIITLMDGSKQMRPAVALNSFDDQYLVVWVDDRNTIRGTGLDLYGQLLGADGGAIADDFPISTAPGNQDFPAVVYNSINNQYLVVWLDARNRPAQNGQDIYGQPVRADGRLVSGNFPIATGPITRGNPVVAYNDDDNQFLVVWSDTRNYATSGWDVYGQRMGADGLLLSGDFAICTAVGDQGASGVVYNSNERRYLVVWTDTRARETSGLDIYGQIVEADGRLFFLNIPISTAPRDQRLPTVAYNSTDNEYLVVWLDNRAFGPNWQIYGQRIDAFGRQIQREFYVNDAPTIQGAVALAYNGPDNTYLAVWDDGRNRATSGQDIFAVPMRADGGTRSSPFPVTSASGDQRFPGLAYNSDDHQFLVVWEDGRNFAGRSPDIYGQILGTAGVLKGVELRVSPDPDPGPSPTQNRVGNPGAAYNSTDDEYLVVWPESDPAAPLRSSIYGQRIDGAGRLLSHRFQISMGSQNAQNPVVAYNSINNQYLVVWEGLRNSVGSGTHIYGQRLSADGSLISASFAVSVERALQRNSAVVFNSVDNRYLVVWEDTRNSDESCCLNIYGQIVEGEGRLITNNFFISIGEFRHDSPSAAYNNADNEYLVVWTDYRNAASTGADIYGQRVRADGTLLADDFVVAAAPRDQQSPFVAYNNADNQYLVVWQDARNLAPAGHRIYGQRVAGNGSLISSNFPVSTGTGEHLKPTVVFNDNDDRYLVVWVDFRPTETDGTINGQRMGAGGQLIAGNFSISRGARNPMNPVVMANNNDNQYLAVWLDSRNSDTHGLQIYGHLIE